LAASPGPRRATAAPLYAARLRRSAVPRSTPAYPAWRRHTA